MRRSQRCVSFRGLVELLASAPAAPLDEAIGHYREVRVDWNESVDRVFAFAEIYFGVGVRRILKDRVYEDFASAGRAVDLTITTIRNRDTSLVAIPRLDRKLARLASTVFGVDLALLSMIRDGTIGISAPGATEAVALEDQDRPFAEIGDSGKRTKVAGSARSRRPAPASNRPASSVSKPGRPSVRCRLVIRCILTALLVQKRSRAWVWDTSVTPCPNRAAARHCRDAQGSDPCSEFRSAAPGIALARRSFCGG
jgi:hypothetical protein